MKQLEYKNGNVKSYELFAADCLIGHDYLTLLFMKYISEFDTIKHFGKCCFVSFLFKIYSSEIPLKGRDSMIQGQNPRLLKISLEVFYSNYNMKKR